VRVTFDNDLFAPPKAGRKAADYEYTAGTRLSWATLNTRWWAGPLGATTDSAARLRTLWEFGQEIYTPRHDSSQPVAGERAYAGWLYGAVTAEETRRGRRRALSLQFGVTGPPSLAGDVQTELHRLAGFTPPLGWTNQIAFQPGVGLRYAESRTIEGDLGGAAAELGPEWEVALGNVLTGAHAGLRAKLGSAGLRRGGGGLYAAVAVREEWVGRNLFLDGKTFYLDGTVSREGPSVRKRPFVPQAEVSLGTRLGWLGFEYRATWRGREYETQDRPHKWGSFALSVNPRWIDAGR